MLTSLYFTELCAKIELRSTRDYCGRSIMLCKDVTNLDLGKVDIQFDMKESQRYTSIYHSLNQT